MFLGISRVPNYKLRNMSVFILVYGSKVGCQVLNNGKILPISCAWQYSDKQTKLAAVHDFGRLNDGTRGKHSVTKKNAAPHIIFGRTLPILYLWQDCAKFVNLAVIHKKINTQIVSQLVSLSLYIYTGRR